MIPTIPAPTGGHGVRRPDCRVMSFADIPGWSDDDHATAARVFSGSAEHLRHPGWASVRAAVETVSFQDGNSCRSLFEELLVPVTISENVLFTGYYEPWIDGSLSPEDAYPVALHRPPPDLPRDVPWATRREIEERRLLEGRSLEIVWIADPVERFFLQVQGSGRIRLRDGRSLRVGYAARNNRPYRSIGQELIRRGAVDPSAISAEAIRSWLADNPEEATALLWHNPSYVFFRRLPDLHEALGPIGTLGAPVTAGRSLAVDPEVVPLGAPVWVEKRGADPLARLFVAQDTGSAIKGADRADIFVGTGDAAGRVAGAMRDRGRMIALLPRDHPLAVGR